MNRFLLLPLVCTGLMLTSIGLAEPLAPVNERHLSVHEFASEPQIATPIGLTVDDTNRVFVIESHTHLRPTDYDGPVKDRVKVFRDLDGDNRAETVTVFADGLQAAMNLALSPDGTLFVVCAREVCALPDEDGDGRCDEIRSVVRLETKERYPHNCLLGIAFDAQGWMYVTRGNLSSRKHAIVGTDNSQVSGYGNGGNIVRCRPDGSQLSEFATGFWNPFDITFDSRGRLLCVDNDPDARGPNRLCHVVRGGDYGYKSMFGGGGNHPYQGWDGSLPGTLPMISGTGEAPSGVLDCRRTSFPEEYQQGILVTVWNEHTIEWHQTSTHGHSLAGSRQVLFQGDSSFRPVAIDADRHGNVFVTDWKRVEYPNHGEGRVWKLTASAGAKPLGRFEQNPLPTPATLSHETNALLPFLAQDDPFHRHAIEMRLAEIADHATLVDATTDTDPRIRLGALLALRRSSYDDPQTLLPKMLQDTNLQVRTAAMMWIGEEQQVGLRDALDQVIDVEPVSASLFEMYLATLEQLHPDFIAALQDQTFEKARDLPRQLDTGILHRLIFDSNRSPKIRSIALQRMTLDDSTRLQVMSLLESESIELRTAAIRRLASEPSEQITAKLVGIAKDTQLVQSLRTEAILALAGRDPLPIEELIDQWQNNDLNFQRQLVRTLAFHLSNARVKQSLRDRWDQTRSDPHYRSVADQIELAFRSVGAPVGTTPPRKADGIESWQALARQGGDPIAGERVFRAKQLACAKCHTVNGRGGRLGPDLSHVAQSMDRQQIVQAIARPSDHFPPQYQAWIVTTQDGQVHSGLQMDHKSGGAIEMFTTDGKTVKFTADQIEDYQAAPRSIMPDGLCDQMTRDEFRDLISFLLSLK